ncbi:MAG TPA: helix-turn-helix domain-containing protein, partial [Chloroflexota bacterium]|nr:helix-turn-helix domain-containing protein [Chloroflexota bacterium]
MDTICYPQCSAVQLFACLGMMAMSEESASWSVAALLRSYRRAAGLTQEQLAERAGLSARGISDLERDEQRVPRRETLDLLVRALDLDRADRATLERAIRQRRARGQPVTPAQEQSAPPAAPTAALPTGMLSVLIADVRGYSAFTHQHGDAAGARLALRFTGLAEEVIATAGGQVVEVRGDEVLGVFTSAHGALRAATGLVARCAEEATADLPLRAGVGVDAGEPIAVPGGYRGEAVNTAARLCAQAGPGEVLASEVVVGLARRVEGLVYQDRGALTLKGLSRPVRTWLVRTGGDTEEHAPPTVAARMAATLAAGFDLLPVEYQQVVRLAQDRYQISVTPLQALAGGWSGAMVYLVNVSCQNPERLEHFVLKLDRKNEKAQANETRRHDAAMRLSPPDFAAQHLARMAFEPVEADGALGIFYSIAGQSLHHYRTIGAYEGQSQVETIFAHVYPYLLSDWNAARTFTHMAHPSALLEQWLSFRLKPGSHIEAFLETVCRVPSGIAGFLIRGSIFPNPLAYARTPEWWGAVRPLDVMVGLQHGDLNTNNMLIKFAKSGDAVEGYYLIDFAQFKDQMPLVFDLRYLEMSYLLLRQSQLSFAKVADLIARLGEADTLDAQQVPIDVAGLCGVIGATRRAYANWIDDHHASLHDDLWGQFWLAGVAAGLCYCYKPGLDNEQRMSGLVYAAANLKRYAVLFGVPTPSEGQQLYGATQVGPNTATGSPSLASAGQSPPNLPAQGTAFIGRETELSSLTALLSDRHNRLVTIVAPGGMGKTRLALEAAGQLQRAFPQGVYFVALDRLSSADLIVQAVAEALPISLSSKEDPKSRIVGYLQDKATLLVMDNFEHVLDGAVFVQDLLGSAPRVQILATSRAKLNLMSETLFTIEGLLVDEISPERNSALQLFAQSAWRARPGFALDSAVAPAVTRICRMVDGMPLAIVLAAAWIDTLSVDEIAAEIEKSIDILETELRDVSDRQRSVRAVIESSWNQVDASAQDLLKRLA